MTNEEYREKLIKLESELILEKDLNKLKKLKEQKNELNNIRKTTILEEKGIRK